MESSKIEAQLSKLADERDANAKERAKLVVKQQRLEEDAAREVSGVSLSKLLSSASSVITKKQDANAIQLAINEIDRRQKTLSVEESALRVELQSARADEAQTRDYDAQKAVVSLYQQLDELWCEHVENQRQAAPRRLDAAIDWSVAQRARGALDAYEHRQRRRAGVN